ncbi:MAG TPA: hypothetical protein VFF78_06810 [Anaerolineaceae bacterium]|nr:hypothetical protein [Anaerolineaceae bacterium]
MRKLTRRELLKVSLGTMGAVALANLPNWNKPSLRLGVLPAHAQASLGTGDLQVTLTWDTGMVDPGGNKAIAEPVRVDLDLYVEEPDGTLVGFYGIDVGPTAALDVDNTWGFGPENIFVGAGNHANGTYYIGVDPFNNSVNTNATIRVTVYANTGSQQVKTYPLYLPAIPDKAPGDGVLNYAIPVAKVDFPAGTISAWNPVKGFKLPGGKKK